MNLFEMTRSSGPRRNNWQKKISLDVYTSGHLKAVSLGVKWIFLSTYLSSNTHGISEIFLCITHWKFFLKRQRQVSPYFMETHIYIIHIYKKKADDGEYSTCGYGNTLYSETWQCACALSIVPQLKPSRQRASVREGERVWVCERREWARESEVVESAVLSSVHV